MKKWTNYLFLIVIAGVFSVSCSKKEEKKEEKKDVAALDKAPVASEKKARKAYAVLDPTEGSDAVGAVTFTEATGGVRVIADIGGLKPGKYGFHIHENGDCSAPDATSAGAHYNPTKEKHGGPESSERHVGDLGNIEVNASGFAHYDRIDEIISLEGPNSIIGKSILIHEKEDDLKTDPSGNSGKRIACGVITVAE